MAKFVKSVIFVLFILKGSLIVFSQNSSENASMIPSLTADRLQEYVAVLTSDSMKGRHIANGGEIKAGQYIADFFQQNGLSDALEPGYRQCFPIINHRNSCDVSFNNKAVTDFVFWGQDSTTQWHHLPVFFAGYHHSIPDSIENHAIIVFAMDISDIIASIDTLRKNNKNNVFLLFFGDNNYTYQYIAKSHRSYINNSFNQKMNIFHIAFQPMNEQDPELQLFFFNDSDFKTVTSYNIRSIKKKARAALTMKRPSSNILPPMTLKYRVQTEIINNITCNIIGYLEGTTHKDEVVVIGAHYDHLGVDKHQQIYRGADDNASGTAALMALSQCFTYASKNNIRPQRSLLFIAFGSEESGLLGSKYYTKAPSIPLKQTVAMINMDMIGRGKEDQMVYVENYGKDSEFLKKTAKNNEIGLDIKIKEAPFTQKIIYRYASDHYHFVTNEIPCIVFFTGTHDDYHTVNDTSDLLNYKNMERITKLVFKTVWEIANEDF
ncbi:MAG: M28 family peptidase [Bacteroidales bacterium]|nr:M28 family peptidase [Bacteroidales bacterium]